MASRNPRGWAPSATAEGHDEGTAAKGILYLTRNGVLVFDDTGRQIEHIQIPGERWTTNGSFCGKDRHTLSLTAGTGLYAVRMRVKGANIAK